MATPFINIYDKFFKNIKDAKLLDLMPEEEIKDLLYDYLVKSITLHFKKCKKDLSKRDAEHQEFIEDLSDEEQVILSKCMVVEWLTPFVNDEKSLKDRLTTKDYRAFSPANQLKILTDHRQNTLKEIRELVKSYSYNGFKGYGSL